jgi:hypothetical protein
MKKQIIKDIECDDKNICDEDCDSCCNAAGDAQWVRYDRELGEYVRGPECLAAGEDLKLVRDENQSHRDFINEESEELTDAHARVGVLKELLEMLLPLAFPKKMVYTTEEAGKRIALKERVLLALKED